MANGSRQAAWEFFGTELKRRREDAGFTQVELGARVFVSGGYIGQFEQAIRKPQLDVAQRIDQLLQSGGFFERMWRKLIDDKRYADYFAEVVELERTATKISTFAPTLVPGLLQTAAYATAVMLASNLFVTDEYIEEKVTARRERAKILDDATRPVYWVIMHEHVLRIPVGGGAAMAAQLDHIADLVRLRRYWCRCCRTRRGPTRSWVAWCSSWSSRTPRQLPIQKRCIRGTCWTIRPWFSGRRAYDLLRAAALSPEASLTLIESAAEEHRRCAGTT